MSEEPRKVARFIDYKCYAPESILDIGLFDISEEHQEIIKRQGGLDCEGIGLVRSHCRRCHYSEPHGYNAPKEIPTQKD